MPAWLRPLKRRFLASAVVLVLLFLVGAVLPQAVITWLKPLTVGAEQRWSTAPAPTVLLDMDAYRSAAGTAGAGTAGAGTAGAGTAGAARGEGNATGAGKANAGATPANRTAAEPPFGRFVRDTKTQVDLLMRTVASDSRKNADVAVEQRLSEGDRTIVEILDQVRLVRHSTFPVSQAASAMTINIPGLDFHLATGPFTRDGLQYDFPFTTERVSYSFFDPLTLQSAPLDYVDPAYFGDVKTQEFHQSIEAVDLTEVIARGRELAAEPLAVAPEDLVIAGPAREFFTREEMADRNVGAFQWVELRPYYSVDRTLWVEPKSGVIVDRSETLTIELDISPEMAAASQARARTVLATTARWDEATRAQGLATARPVVRQLRLFSSLSLLAQTAAVLLVGWLCWSVYRQRMAWLATHSAAHAGSAPTPAATDAAQPAD